MGMISSEFENASGGFIHEDILESPETPNQRLQSIVSPVIYRAMSERAQDEAENGLTWKLSNIDIMRASIERIMTFHEPLSTFQDSELAEPELRSSQEGEEA